MQGKRGKNSASFLDKKIIFIFLLIFLIPFISSKNISVRYDNKVEVDEKFDVNLELIDFPEDVYDVKIEVLNDGERVGEIEGENGWMSCYYYIKKAIKNNEKEKFYLKISEEGKMDLVFKIRNSKGTSYTFEGYKIKAEEKEISENSGEIEKIEEKIEDKKDEFEEIKYGFEEISKEEVIKLTPKNIKREDDAKDKSNYAFYGFVMFCILLVLLFVHKKLRYMKNEFN